MPLVINFVPFFTSGDEAGLFDGLTVCEGLSVTDGVTDGTGVTVTEGTLLAVAPGVADGDGITDGITDGVTDGTVDGTGVAVGTGVCVVLPGIYALFDGGVVVCFGVVSV